VFQRPSVGRKANSLVPFLKGVVLGSKPDRHPLAGATNTNEWPSQEDRVERAYMRSNFGVNGDSRARI